MSKRIVSGFVVCIMVFGVCGYFGMAPDMNGTEVYAAKTYKITPKTKSKRYKKSKLYNKKTKNYFVVREKLEKLQKSKGGTLIFKKGTYTMSNAVYVPSNVKIIFEDGVVIKKGKKTGVKKWKASTSLFQLIKPSKSKKSKVYGKYNSSSNVTFEGRGNVVIDLRYYKKNHAILAAHNRNLTVNNITFKNSNVGHFIELNSNYNARILNCKFLNSKGDTLKEAINIDTPDKKTGGWDQKWSKFDKTACQNVTIDNCYFSNMGHAIGTHKYSYGHPHINIRITNCTIVGTRGEEAIRMQNWQNPVIMNNRMSGNGSSKVLQGVIGRGVSYPTIQNNHFSNFSEYMIRIRDGWNVGAGSSYPHIYSYVSGANMEGFKTNTISNMKAKSICLQLGKNPIKNEIVLE